MGIGLGLREVEFDEWIYQLRDDKLGFHNYNSRLVYRIVDDNLLVSSGGVFTKHTCNLTDGKIKNDEGIERAKAYLNDSLDNRKFYILDHKED